MGSRSIADLSASLRWDLADFDRGTAHIEGVFGRLRGFIVGVSDAIAAAGQRMTLGITAPLAGLAVYTVKAASDAQELQSAFDYTFGRMAARMNRWAEESGNAMGRATEEMQAGALALGVLFRQAAPTEEAAASMSQQFAELAQDASSFFNVPFEEALAKIRSGLTGEAEPLRDFGVFLSEATVEAKALELGLIRTGEELTEEGKIMARAAVIAEAMSAAKGDVARTSDSLANRIRALRAEMHELAAEMGERLMPYAERVVGWLRSAVQWFGNLPAGVKDAIVGMAIFAAAAGPVILVLRTLTIFLLPLLLPLLLSLPGILGPIAVGFVAIMNPLGTLIIMGGKLVSEMGLVGAVIGRLGGFILRLGGPVAWIIGLIITFRGEIASAFRTIGALAEQYLGPKIDHLKSAFARLGQAFDQLMAGPLGQLIRVLRDALGAVIERLVTLFGAGMLVIVGAVIDAVTAIADSLGHIVATVNDVVGIVRALIDGNWSGAWQRAKEAVGNAMQAIASWVALISPELAQFLNLVGRVLGAGEEARARTQGQATVGNGAFSGLTAMLEAVSGVGGRSYAIADNDNPRSRKSGGSSGPSAEELAYRRETLRIDNQIAVARERNDIEVLRALERQRDLRDLIRQYQSAGLSLAEAQVAAEADLAEIDAARAAARDRSLRAFRNETERQVAELNNDYQHLRYLDDEEARERIILELRQKGWDLTQAETQAAARLAAIEEARAYNMLRRLNDQQLAHEIELARLRGDDTSGLEEQARISSRTDELQREFGMSRAAAEERAMREAAERSQAHLQGTFRDAFRGGLQAALDGNLGRFFKDWLKQNTFDALSQVLDRLADQLAALISGQNGSGASASSGGGGLFGSLLAGVSGLARKFIPGVEDGFAGGDAAWATASNPPGFATGGSFKISGFPGIDRNTLALNGNPIARVSHGEIVDVRQGSSSGTGAVRVIIEDTTGLFQTRVEQISGAQLSSAGPGLIEAGANAGVARMHELQAASLA